VCECGFVLNELFARYCQAAYCRNPMFGVSG
jgi:hypothetical protein